MAFGAHIQRAREWLSNHPGIVAVVLLAAIIRLGQFLIVAEQIGMDGILALPCDGRLYLETARDILAGSEGYEKGFTTFGPGYAAFLAPFLYLFGESAIPIVLTQIILSSITCGITYAIAWLLLRNKTVALLSGLIVCMSCTSITLTVLVLSDTLFLFLFSATLLLFIIGLEKLNWYYFIGAGVLLSAAILVRAVGQFWGFGLVLLAVLYRWFHGRGHNQAKAPASHFWTRVVVCALISILTIAIWSIRNDHKHGFAALTLHSAVGPANMAVWTIERQTGQDHGEIRIAWIDEYRADHDIDEMQLSDYYRMYRTNTRKVFLDDPIGVISTYLRMNWINVNEISRLHRLVLPDFNPTLIGWEHFTVRNQLNYLPFWITIAGLIVLAVRKEWWAFAFLCCAFFYFAFIVGFVRYQGSRVFFPGLLASAILSAVFLHALFVKLTKLILHKKTPT